MSRLPLVLALKRQLGLSRLADMPPDPDPCQAVQGTIAYAFLGNLVNAAPFKTWKKGAPGEMTRLAGIMLSPRCSTASSPQPQIMKTFMGAALADAFAAYGCARGQGPLVWPPVNPPPLAGSTDTTPPGAPGPILVTPSG